MCTEEKDNMPHKEAKPTAKAPGAVIQEWKARREAVHRRQARAHMKRALEKAAQVEAPLKLKHARAAKAAQKQKQKHN